MLEASAAPDRPTGPSGVALHPQPAATRAGSGTGGRARP
jgi:hypothetical protein